VGQLLVVVSRQKSSDATTRTDPWSDGSAKLELAIYYGEPNRISRLKISGGVTSDLGSVSTGYSDRPWCTGKQLPPGLSLTGPESYKRQASSLTAGEGYCRMNLERINYD